MVLEEAVPANGLATGSAVELDFLAWTQASLAAFVEAERLLESREVFHLISCDEALDTGKSGRRAGGR